MWWLLVLALAGPDGSTPAAPAAHDPRVVTLPPAAVAAAIFRAEARRIRTMDARITKLLADGVQRSSTFATMVAALQESDVIVYIELKPRLSSKLAARLLLQGVAGGQRYLRVQVRPNLPNDQMIAIIAHELRHALEVAADASVVDQAGLLSLYERIGYRTASTGGYDTEAARRAGETVHLELRG